jgi:pimeloyl-ACP methyl ester carboxylesterase
MLTIRSTAGPQGLLALDDAGGGDGLPVVFIHADLGNFTQWREALDHLRPGHRALALDLRGHGRSAPAADGDYSIEGRADDVAAVMDAVALPRVVLVGHSGGAAVALRYAAQHATRVAGVFLVDPASDGRQVPADQRQHLMERLHSPSCLDTAREYYTSIVGANAAVRERVLWDVDGARNVRSHAGAHDVPRRTTVAGHPAQRHAGLSSSARSVLAASRGVRHRPLDPTG